MREVLQFAILFVAVFVLGAAFDCLSQLTYQGRSLGEIRQNLGSTAVRMLILTTVLIIAAMVWQRMGWYS